MKVFSGVISGLRGHASCWPSPRVGADQTAVRARTGCRAECSRRACSTGSAQACGAPRDALVADLAPPDPARRRIRLAAGARHRGRFAGPFDRRRADAAVGQRFQGGIRRGRHPGGTCGFAAGRRVREPPPSQGRSGPIRSPGPTFVRPGWLLVGGRHRRRVHAGTVFRGLSGAARRADRRCR